MGDGLAGRSAAPLAAFLLVTAGVCVIYISLAIKSSTLPYLQDECKIRSESKSRAEKSKSDEQGSDSRSDAEAGQFYGLKKLPIICGDEVRSDRQSK